MKTARAALAAVALTLAACSQPLIPADPTPAVIVSILPTEPPPSPTPAPDPIYLSLIWHLHQPLYATDPQTGLVTQPWVRLNATWNYYDTAAMIEQHSNIKATISLSPVLIKQLDDLANGARDVHWELSVKPAAQLSADDKRFILGRFFDTPSPGVIAAHPRYQELLNKRGGEAAEQIETVLQTFTEQDFRDVQIWFNLAWFAPDLLAEPPLSELVARGRGFTEADKTALFNKTLDVIRSVVPSYRALQQAGQVEVITTPYAHPILPLLTDTNLHKAGDAKATVPTPPFAFPQDAAEQVKRSVQVYQQHFGAAPQGLWPSEGAVSTQLIKPASEAGYGWMASSERVLAKTLAAGEDGFARDSGDVVQEADKLYRPYIVETQDGAAMAMVFGDQRLSALIGGEYDAMDSEAAAQDFIDRLLRTRAELESDGAAGPHMVSVVLDGEEVWNAYADGGKAFLDALYRKLGEAEARGEIETTTPGAYLAQFPDQQRLSELSAGTQFRDGFAAWIGEPEENTAWSYLLRTRRFLDDYLTGKKPAEQRAIDQAYEAMLLAEGSDWLWHYGSDHDGEDDGYFDRSFRALLGQVYDALGVPQPEYVNVPIITPAIAAPAQMLQGVITPTIDGAVVEGEWELAGAVRADGSATAGSISPIAALYYGLSPKDMVFRADGAQEWNALVAAGQPVRMGAYVKLPDEPTTAMLSRLGPDDTRRAPLGMPASHLLEWTLDPNGTASAVLYKANDTGGWSAVAAPSRARVASAATGQVLEMSAPLELIGEAENLRTGDSVQLIALATQGGRVLGQLPANGIAQMVVP
jgi:alpha-amylase/alpha-mannosidase (GH57 family)